MGASELTTFVRRRIFLLVAALVVLVASVVLIYGALAGSEDSPARLTQEIGTPAPKRTTQSADSFSPTLVPTPSPIPPFVGQAFRIAIDKIGVDAPVVTEGLDADLVPQVPLNGYEVAWYDFSAQPGTPGNAVFAGHKTWSGEGVFYNLDQLQVGDIIRLRGEGDGVELLYSVSESFTVSEDDPNGVQVMLYSPRDIVTIITCDGTRYYTGDSTFGHDYTERRVIRAERVTQALG